MTRIGVISDTHGRLEPRAFDLLSDCDCIIHAGDICSPAVLNELRVIGPVYAVLGNNDYDEYGPDVQHFARPVIDGVRFLVAHKPNDVQFSPLGNAAFVPGEPLPQVIIHGHTHVPRLVRGKAANPADLLMNPGATFRPLNGVRSVGFIEVHDGAIISAHITNLRGELIPF